MEAMPPKPTPLGINYVLAHHVARLMAERGWSQPMLEKNSGVKQTTLSLILHPEKRSIMKGLNVEASANLAYVQAIADAFEVSVLDMLAPIIQPEDAVPMDQRGALKQAMDTLAMLAEAPRRRGAVVVAALNKITDPTVLKLAEQAAVKAVSDTVLGPVKKARRQPAKHTKPAPARAR
jgi:hypothetical protein